MTLRELEDGWIRLRPASVIGMKKVLCLCHYKWVWVGPNEKLPYWCVQKELHAPLAE